MPGCAMSLAGWFALVRSLIDRAEGRWVGSMKLSSRHFLVTALSAFTHDAAGISNSSDLSVRWASIAHDAALGNSPHDSPSLRLQTANIEARREDATRSWPPRLSSRVRNAALARGIGHRTTG